ncbi:probable glutathione S-transferase GSTU6, partial [Phalaenopsis equestris]
QEDKEKAAAEAAAALHPLEKAFETASKGKPFFGGDDIGFIDIALGCFLPWIRALQKLDGIQILSDNTFPNLSTWAQNFSAHDAAKVVLPDNDKMPEVIRTFRALFSAA